MARSPLTGKTRPTSPLTRKLAWFAELSQDEVGMVERLPAASRLVRRNREIVTEGRHYDSLFVLLEGVAIRYRVLHDGRRQVLNIALPGDFVGFPACFFETALYSITALTDTMLAPVPFARLMALFEQCPRLAATIFWSFGCEAAMYAEHLIDVGRRSALERVAHFLLELLIRLQVIGSAEGQSYRMPLTQELMGDALGLSVPHVNRTLRQLRDDDLVSIEDQRVIIKDFEGLSALADFDKIYLSRFRIPRLMENSG